MELKTITIASLLQIYEGDFSTDWVVKDFVNIIILNELNKYNFVFKGGTALYKQLEGDMHRFSEDIDLYMDKDEYEKNKKAIKETINLLPDYEIIQKIEFDESQSGSNTRVYNIYYSDDNASDVGIDSGRCQIEIALVGGTPTQKSECDIHSIIKFENTPILTTKFNCVNISEILVDKLFIIMDSDKEEYNKRNNRDFYDVFFIVNEQKISTEELMLSIKNREQRNDHHRSGKSVYKPEILIEKIKEYKNEFKSYWLLSNLFNDSPPSDYDAKYSKIESLINSTSNNT